MELPKGFKFDEERAKFLASEYFKIFPALSDVEKNHIMAALKHNKGNKTKASKDLGITIKTLYNKLHEYGLMEKYRARIICPVVKSFRKKIYPNE